MTDVALGVKVLSRTKKLEQLLSSANGTGIKTVYIADDGEMTQEKELLYSQDYSFDIQVLNLEYNAGLAYGRNRIIENLTEEYLLLVDADHEVPPNYSVLKDQLDARDDLGGVCGMLLEDGRIRVKCKDVYEEGKKCIWDVRGTKTTSTEAGFPLIEFDLIENAAMLRKSCLEDQKWDPEYIIGWEHEDFYLAHKKNTEWNFALSPQVYFPHNPGGEGSYTDMRHNEEIIQKSRKYFLDKWGYDSVKQFSHNYIDTYGYGYPREEFPKRAYNIYKSEGLVSLLNRGVKKFY